jgi:hypothetical protein
MRRRQQDPRTHNHRRKADAVPVEKRSQSRLWPAFDGGFGYADLVVLAERCVRSDLERDNLPPVNSKPLIDWMQRNRVE